MTQVENIEYDSTDGEQNVSLTTDEGNTFTASRQVGSDENYQLEQDRSEVPFEVRQAISQMNPEGIKNTSDGDEDGGSA